MGLVTGPIRGASSELGLRSAVVLGLATPDSARSRVTAAGPPGWPKSVMVRTPAASRQAMKEQPKASARPALDARKPSAESAAAAMPLLRIGMVTPGLTTSLT